MQPRSVTAESASFVDAGLMCAALARQNTALCGQRAPARACLCKTGIESEGKSARERCDRVCVFSQAAVSLAVDLLDAGSHVVVMRGSASPKKQNTHAQTPPYAAWSLCEGLSTTRINVRDINAFAFFPSQAPTICSEPL